MRSARNKLGRFIFFIGLIALVVFFAIDQSKNPAYGYFCGGIVFVILGFILMRNPKQEGPAESLRFRTLRRWREQMKQRKEERKNQPFKQ